MEHTLTPGQSEADESTLRDSKLTSDPVPRGAEFPAAASFIGQRCGPYQIVREVGRGGMGAVYLAGRVDDEFKQRVAIKVLRTGIDAEEILRRFRHERQILATLDHPNIARLLDGGSTAAGEPYLVMDYVEGISIDQFCDNNRLSIPERIALFRQLCAAVHYVHQNLIVHRDLKPGNILVRAEGVVKLLDFGIAKILKPEMMASVADATRANELLLTPAYASPEQARGEPITTVSDVYSLGIILYELLTGQRPYRPRTDSALEMVRSICEDEPPRPSTMVTRVEKGGQPAAEQQARKRGTIPEKLRLRLKGDLDNILLKALRKEPQRRYASVEQFSADLERHLRDDPVLAHDDSRWYRARKFVHRNRVAVAGASLAMVALLAGIVATTIEARVASRERARAEARFQDVRKLASTLMFDVNDQIQNLPGSTPARSLIASTGTQYFDSLAREAQGDASLQQELTEGYLRLGAVQGDPYGANLGHTNEAVESYRKALALATTLTAQHPHDLKARQLLGRSQIALAGVLAVDGQVSEAYDHASHAVTTYQMVSDAQPTDAKSQLDLAGAYESRGDIVGGAQSVNLGRSAEALADYEKSLSLVPQVPASSSLAPRATRVRAVMLTKIGRVQGRRGNWVEAESDYQQALVLATQLSNADPLNQNSSALLSATLNQLGFAQESLDDLAAAQATFLRVAELDETALRADPNNSRASDNVMVAQKNLGDLYFHGLHKWPEALRCYRRVGELLETQSAADPSNLVARERLAINDTYIASTLLRMNQPAEARRETMAGLALAKQLADRPNPTYDQLYNYAWLATTAEPDDLADPAGALPYIQRAVAMDKGSDPLSLIVLADAYAGVGDYQHAVSTIEKADALFPPMPPGKASSRQQQTVRERLNRYQSQLAKATQRK